MFIIFTAYYLAKESGDQEIAVRYDITKHVHAIYRDIFQKHKLKISLEMFWYFIIFAQNIDYGYTQSMFWSKRKRKIGIPLHATNLLYKKWGLREYKLHGLVFLMIYWTQVKTLRIIFLVQEYLPRIYFLQNILSHKYSIVLLYLALWLRSVEAKLAVLHAFSEGKGQEKDHVHSAARATEVATISTLNRQWLASCTHGIESNGKF